MHSFSLHAVVPLPRREELAATCPPPHKKSSPCSPQHNCRNKQALIMHIMHNIIRVSLSAGKQLHLWIRNPSKLGEPNYTSRQLFADLPKTIWWSQPSSSQAGVCFTANISSVCMTDKLASKLSRRALLGLFPTLALGLIPPGREDRQGMPGMTVSPQQRPKGECEFPAISV